MTFFEDPRVIAFISDAAIDFTPIDFDTPLTRLQQAYLRSQTGVEIPQVFWRKQVHGDDILIARGSVANVRGCPDADAYITKERNLPIAIRTADCVPVLIYDSLIGAIGVAHAGWKGTYEQIAFQTVQCMQEEFGSSPSQLKVVLGPSIRTCCYEVGEEFRKYFPQDIITRDGKLYADVNGANRTQLLKAGVSPEHIIDTGLCTCCSKDYFSFRRDADKSGRMISLMMLR